VAWLAVAALPIAAPFAGMAEAADAAKKPTAADMAAANRTVLNVIPSSVIEARRRPGTGRIASFDPPFLHREP
jgi:hypothetical protein